MADIIDGRAIARELDEKTKAEVDAMVAAGQPRPAWPWSWSATTPRATSMSAIR